MNIRNVLIVGSGPSGLWAAKTLLEQSPNINVTILEKGHELENRLCSINNNQECTQCSSCNMISGVGGSGLFSDGKLLLDLNAGGNLEFINNSGDSGSIIAQKIAETYVEFSELAIILDHTKEHKNITDKLDFKYYNIAHIGTDNLKTTINNFVKYLKTYGDRFDLISDYNVDNITTDNNKITVNDEYIVDAIILAVGKTGNKWLRNLEIFKNTKFYKNNFRFGLRLVTKTKTISNLLDITLDPKISLYFDNEFKVKMHCVCKNGKIRLYNFDGFSVVGGHSKLSNSAIQKDSKANNFSNFNILIPYNELEDIKPYGEMLQGFKEESNNRILVQKLGEFIDNEINIDPGLDTPTAKHANIRKVLEKVDPSYSEYLYLFLLELNEICPGVLNDDNLLYGPAIEWTADRIATNKSMQVDNFENVYAIGDGAGISQGIIYSSFTGDIAARSIIKKYVPEKRVSNL